MITPIYAAIFAIMLIALSLNVIKGRRLYGAGIGDAGNIDLKRRIRAQANLAEYTPMFLILAGFSEHGGLPSWMLHALCLIFLSARIMHAYSLLRDEKYQAERLTANPVWRIRGMMLTFGTIGTLAIILFVQSIAS